MADITSIAEAIVAGDLTALSELDGVNDYELLIQELGDNEKVKVIVAQDVPDLAFALRVRQDEACYPLDEDEVAEIVQEYDDSFEAGDDLTADLAVYVAAKVYTDESGETVDSQRAGTESEDEWTGWCEGFAFTLTRDADEYELVFAEGAG